MTAASAQILDGWGRTDDFMTSFINRTEVQHSV